MTANHLSRRLVLSCLAMEQIDRSPPNLLTFVSLEQQQFMVSLANNRDDFEFLTRLDVLYSDALSHCRIRENDAIILQLLSFTHYHFLFATASLMRCHLSEAFGSARAAIDAALVGAQIIHDRPSQEAYMRRDGVFTKYSRYLGNLIKSNGALPHHLVRILFDLHKQISTFAIHADVDSFIHRADVVNVPKTLATFEYFQFPRSEAKRKLYATKLLLVFVMVLDVFSDFLVVEQKLRPQEWQDALRRLGHSLNLREEALNKSTVSESDPAT